MLSKEKDVWVYYWYNSDREDSDKEISLGKGSNEENFNEEN